jgi:hypothetical protein
MVFRKTDGRHQDKKNTKPRGRPPKRKDTSETMDTERRSSGNERGVIEEGDGIEFQLPAKAVEILQAQEITETKIEVPTDETKEGDKAALTLIDSLDFMLGENKLSIRFSKKHNRMFRIQVFLNESSEIRPVTYTGASTAYSFWNLLKGALKK